MRIEAILNASVRQFLRFSVVGVAGFLVDATVLHLAMNGLGFGHYLGRVVSFLVAATSTWALNRRFTFDVDTRLHPLKEWLRFLGANALGGIVNYTVYALLVAHVSAVAGMPTLGVAAGSLAGLIFNFTMSKKLVFVEAARSG